MNSKVCILARPHYIAEEEGGVGGLNGIETKRDRDLRTLKSRGNVFIGLDLSDPSEALGLNVSPPPPRTHLVTATSLLLSSLSADTENKKTFEVLMGV